MSNEGKEELPLVGRVVLAPGYDSHEEELENEKAVVEKLQWRLEAEEKSHALVVERLNGAIVLRSQINEELQERILELEKENLQLRQQLIS